MCGLPLSTSGLISTMSLQHLPAFLHLFRVVASFWWEQSANTSMTTSLSTVPRVVQRAIGAPGLSGPSHLRPPLLLLQIVAAFLARRLTRLLCSWKAPSSHETSASSLRPSIGVAKASFTDMFGQSLELGKQAHPFWDFSVHGVSVHVLQPRRPFIQMLTFLCAFVTNRFR